MKFFSKIFGEYGEKVEGYEVNVLNEREARAAAGLLFVGAFLALINGVLLGDATFSKYFITFFTIDFLIRVIQPRYAPSLLIGRFFVQNQTPEYVGAAQKRFAWLVGLIIALPMFYYLVIDFKPNPIKVLICVICMVLLFLESAFSICVGCKIYNLLYKKSSKYCPGGVCEIKKKEKVQTFDTIQKIILFVSSFLILYFLYFYTFHTKDKTIFFKKLQESILTQEQLEELEYQKALEEFENDDF